MSNKHYLKKREEKDNFKEQKNKAKQILTKQKDNLDLREREM